MKREELLEKLKKCIPSFHREYTGYPNGEWDWLFRNDYNTHAPTKIPYDFLEGEKMVDIRGRELIISNKHLRPDHIEYKKTHKELPGHQMVFTTPAIMRMIEHFYELGLNARKEK